MNHDRAHPAASSFPALKGLAFIIYDRVRIRSCASFLRVFRPVKVTAFSLRLSTPSRSDSESFSPDDSLDLVQAIHDVIPHDQLITFSLFSPGAGIAPITLDGLRLLFPFNRMSHVTLVRCLNVDDSGFEEMATAWPHLTQLHATNCWCMGRRPRSWVPAIDEHSYWAARDLGDPPLLTPTLRTLEHFVQRCSTLETLHIEVVGSKVEALQPSTCWAEGHTNPRILTLGLGRSVLGFTEAVGTSMFHVSTFLYDLFPNLTTLVIDEDSPSLDQWRQVQEIVRGLAVFRSRLTRA